MPKDFPPSSPAGPPQPPQSNWPFAVIAMLMAVVLWLFVRTGATPLGQRIVWLPVTVAHAEPHLTISPSRVEVRLEATPTAVDRMSPEEVTVMADLAGHQEGDLVTLTVVPPPGFKVLGTSVTHVRVVAGNSGHPTPVPTR